MWDYSGAVRKLWFQLVPISARRRLSHAMTNVEFSPFAEAPKEWRFDLVPRIWKLLSVAAEPLSKGLSLQVPMSATSAHDPCMRRAAPDPIVLCRWRQSKNSATSRTYVRVQLMDEVISNRIRAYLPASIRIARLFFRLARAEKGFHKARLIRGVQ